MVEIHMVLLTCVLYGGCTEFTVRPTCPMYGGVSVSTCSVLVSP